MTLLKIITGHGSPYRDRHGPKVHRRCDNTYYETGIQIHAVTAEGAGVTVAGDDFLNSVAAP